MVQKIGLLGDVHGNRRWLLAAIERFASLAIHDVIQMGDLGIWPGEEAAQTFNIADKALRQRSMQMWVAPGNHEDYDRISGLGPREDGWLPFRPHILLAPRGHRTEINGITFLWLGGAGSIDRVVRLEQDWRERENQLARGEKPKAKSWWPQESITEDDAAISQVGGAADVMICHDAPFPIPVIEDKLAELPQDFVSVDLAHVHASRMRLTKVVEAVRPALLLHGHYHLATDGHFGPTRVVGLGCDGDEAGALAVLDLPSCVVERLSLN
jgi:Icc-related predicted phosphoesterase